MFFCTQTGVPRACAPAVAGVLPAGDYSPRGVVGQANQLLGEGMMALRALLIFLLCGIAPYASAARFHHLDVGFNLGYQDRVHFFEPALAEIL